MEIRDLEQKRHSCTCVDFQVNGLGTCKHIEGVLAYLEARFPRLFKAARVDRSPRFEVVPDPGEGTLTIENPEKPLPIPLRRFFDKGRLRKSWDCEEAVQWFEANSPQEVRISQEVRAWLENGRRDAERKELRREYELKVHSGEWPAHETRVPLFPYQREGMLHLAFTERALLADEMGLGKTIQAIAACALLRRLGRAQPRAGRHARVAQGRVGGADPAVHRPADAARVRRVAPRGAKLTKRAPFFTVVNYEQMIRDALEVNARFRPDVVVLDEAQRIKNWNTQDRPGHQAAAKAVTPSSSPARPSRTALTNCIR